MKIPFSSGGERWYKISFAIGWCLFWLAASRGEGVPTAAVLVGPMVMVAAMILLRRSRSRVHSMARPLADVRGSVALQSIDSHGDGTVEPSTQDRERQGVSEN